MPVTCIANFASDLFPTANRNHLSRVGSSILARPRPTKDGQPYLISKVGAGPRHDIGESCAAFAEW